MKKSEITKLVDSNTSFAIGRFQKFEMLDAKNGEKYGKSTIQIGSSLCEFTVFPPKAVVGAARPALAAPAYAGDFGTPVVLVGYGAKLEGKYIRHNADRIERIEP